MIPRLCLSRSTSGLVATGRYAPLPSPEELAPVMLAAYRGSPDDEGETLAETVEVLRAAMAGGFGPWLPEASLVALDDAGDPVGGILSALDGDRPFVVFVFTRPERTRTGVASGLVSRACEILRDDGHDEIRLWVNQRNEPALGLYRRLGFSEVAVPT